MDPLSVTQNWREDQLVSVRTHIVDAGQEVGLDKKNAPKNPFPSISTVPSSMLRCQKNDLVNVDFSVISSNRLSRDVMVFPLVRLYLCLEPALTTRIRTLCVSLFIMKSPVETAS